MRIKYYVWIVNYKLGTYYSETILINQIINTNIAIILILLYVGIKNN